MNIIVLFMISTGSDGMLLYLIILSKLLHIGVRRGIERTDGMILYLIILSELLHIGVRRGIEMFITLFRILKKKECHECYSLKRRYQIYCARHVSWNNLYRVRSISKGWLYLSKLSIEYTRIYLIWFPRRDSVITCSGYA